MGKINRLSEIDIENMAVGGEFDVPGLECLRKEARKSLKGLKYVAPNDEILQNVVIDCHGKTEEQAFSEIKAEIGRIGAILAHRPNEKYTEVIVITGKSGVIKQDFHISITDGSLKNSIKSWKMINPGCYKIRIKRES